MRRNRGSNATNTSSSTPSTPSILNLNCNSNSCSNDTTISSMSTSTANTNNTLIATPSSSILLNENKIRTLLKDLQVYIKSYDQERIKNEPNLTAINKTHDKIKKEEKLTSFNRKKLRNLYAATLKEADNEIKCLRQVLDCINQVRLTQSEIRIIQQNLRSPTSLLASPKNLSNTLVNFANIKLNLNTSPGSSSLAVNRDTLDEADAKLFKKNPTTMRRGVLMNILQQAALTLPLWVGEIGQSPPPLCGSIPPESNYISKPGDKVAAIVKNNNSGDGESGEEENWILAEVIQYHANTGKYDVEDVDAEEGQESRHTLGKKKVVPLPLWRANPFTDPEAIFQKDSFVLALYPQTTCFYRGIVSESPQTPLEDYLILFEDSTYPEGYSPPLNVPQLYVVADRG